MKTILLDCCCSCCASFCIENLANKNYEVICFFSNSNVHPKNEYLKRLKSMIKLCKKTDKKLIIDKYTPNTWFNLTKQTKQEKEGGKRCDICFKYRIQKLFLFAKKLNIPFISTTLSISPHKNVLKINEIGKQITKNSEITFLLEDYKKNNGFLESIKKSKKYNLYRQNYCGCIYSLKTRNS